MNEAPYIQRPQCSIPPNEHYMVLQENGEWKSYQMPRVVLEAKPEHIRHKVLTEAEIYAEPQTMPAYVRRSVRDYLGIPHFKHAKSPRPREGLRSAAASVPAIDG